MPCQQQPHSSHIQLFLIFQCAYLHKGLHALIHVDAHRCVTGCTHAAHGLARFIVPSQSRDSQNPSSLRRDRDHPRCPKRTQPCNCGGNQEQQDARDRDGIRCVFHSSHNNEGLRLVSIVTETLTGGGLSRTGSREN